MVCCVLELSHSAFDGSGMLVVSGILVKILCLDLVCNFCSDQDEVLIIFQLHTFFRIWQI